MFKKILFTLFFLIASMLLVLPSWLERHFGDTTVAQIEFVLRSTMAGVDMKLVSSFIRYVIIVPVLSMVLLVIFRRVLVKRRLLKTGMHAPLALVSVYLLLAITYITVKYDLVAELSVGDSKFIEERYVKVNFNELVFPETKRNLILIISESLENTFHDKSIFGAGLMPELHDLQMRHVAFSGQCELPGTEWTIAGITSYMFGVPLKLPIGNNRYARFSTFLPKANSILDIMSQSGYDIQMILGSKAEFSGKSNLFSVHAPAARIWDLHYFLETRDDAVKEHGWGVPDSYLFERAKDFFAERETDNPFFLIIETADAHTGTFFVQSKDPHKWGDDRDVFAAQSKMISDFITWVEAQPFFADTTIAVVGDHLLMQNSLAGVQLAGQERSVFNLFLNAGVDTADVKRDRLFSSPDICPTLLESVGVRLKNHRFGLGVSLFSNEPTLLEQYGEERLAREFKARSAFYNSFY